MKLHLPLSLRSSLLSCMALLGLAVSSAQETTFQPKSDLGDTMFVGDSITHGQNQKSWRWNFCKILIDNNISFNEVGVNSGNTSNFGTNHIYGNGVFQNVHAAQSGERAYEIAGTKSDNGTGGRLNGTNIKQWLGREPDTSPNQNRHIDANITPSTYFLLIGTNDLLSQPGNHISQANYQEIKQQLLGDMDVIIENMRWKSGDDVDIVVLTVPTWNGPAVTPNVQNLPADYVCVQQYNDSLKEWAKQRGVNIVDINVGLVDVANTTDIWRAVPTFFGDKLHPSPQGEIIISGNVASALGYAGRTAGQLRKSAEDFSISFESIGSSLGALPASIPVGASLSYDWAPGTDLSHGFTVDFTLSNGVGNGYSDERWNTADNFSVSIGDGVRYGTLHINEAYIRWGDTVLFSMDTSALTRSMRIAYIYANNVKNLPGGFYVWMDDQLIGEALNERTGSVTNGLRIINNSESDVSLEDLNLDSNGSWAPSTSKETYGNPTISPSFHNESGEFPGKKDWAPADDLLGDAITLTNELFINTRLGDKKGGTVSSGSAVNACVNGDTHEGDIYVTLTGDAYIGGNGSYWGFHGCMPKHKADTTFTGNGYLRIMDLNGPKTFGTFFGTLNRNGNGGIVGNLYVEFSSEYVTIANGSYSNVSAAIAGIYSAPGGISDGGVPGDGVFRLVINDGRFANIIGGSINGNSRVENVEFFFNGGLFTGNIAAGGFYGSVGDRSIRITGDYVEFSSVTKLITAGAVPVNDPEAPEFSNLFGTATPNGTVDGNATVTLADMTSASNFRQWEGTLSGGQETGTRTLIFAGVQMEDMKATLKDFDVLVVMSSDDPEAVSDVGLNSIGGATEIQVGEGSKLTLLSEGKQEYGVAQGEELAVDNDGVIALQSGVTLKVTTVHSVQSSGAWEADDATLILGDSVVGTHAITLSSASTLEIGAVQNGNFNISSADAGNSVTISDNASGSFTFDMGDNSQVTIGSDSSGTHDISLGEGSSLSIGDNAADDWTVALGNDSEMTLGDNSSGTRDVSLGEGSSLSIGDNTAGDWTVALGSDSEMTLGNDSTGTYDVSLGEGSTLSIGEGATGDWTINAEDNSEISIGRGSVGEYGITLGAGSSLSSYGSNITGAVVLNGPGLYDMKGGMASGLMLQLKDFAGDSRVLDLGNSDIVLTGENSVTITSAMTDSDAATIDTHGVLSLDASATLHIDVNSVADEVEAKKDVWYYLTNGDISSLGSAAKEGKLVYDATALVLNWTISYETSGAIYIHRNGLVDEKNIYKSKQDNSGTNWGREDGVNIFEHVHSFEAVLVSNDTQLTLTTSDEQPEAYLEDGLIINNLVGTPGARLSVRDDGNHATKLTLTNQIGSEQKEYLKEMVGGEIEESLTFAGDLTLHNLGLQIKHIDPDKKGIGAPNSTTIIKGDLTITGGGDVELTSGVLHLQGSNNRLGSGDIIVAGTDSQMIIDGQNAKASTHGAISLTAGQNLTGNREHIRLMNGGTLELLEGSSVGGGVRIGSSDAPLGEAAGVISAHGATIVSRTAELSNVVLHVGENASINIAADVAPASVRARDNFELFWTLAGLTGTGKFETESRADIVFSVAGGDHTFSGNLAGYSGTMSFEMSDYWQRFAGVTGSKNWNIANKAEGRVELDLAASQNTLTMGKLSLERNSVTSLVFDFTTMGQQSGLFVHELDSSTGAVVYVSQAGDSLITLQGNGGDEISYALVHVGNIDASDITNSKVQSWTLLNHNIKNANEVHFEYRDGIVYLTATIVEENVYSTYAQNINSKAGADMLWPLDSTSMGGDMAGVDFYLANMLASKDKTAATLAEANRVMAAVAGSSTAVLGQAVSGDVERQLRAIRNRTTSISRSGQPGESTADFWLNAESDYHKQNADGLLPGYKTNSWGGTVGASRSIGHGKDIGLALTAMYGDITSAGADHLKGDIDTYYLSAFTQVISGPWRHTLLATVGTASLDVSRTVSYGANSYTTKGSTDGTAFGVMYEVGYSIPVRADGSVFLQPVANVTLRHSKLDAYTESGSNAALNVGAQKNTAVTLGFGARLQAAVDGNFWNRSSLFETRALVKVDCGDRNSETTVAFREVKDAVVSKVRSSEKGAVGVELGAGLSLPVAARGEVFIDCSAELWQHYTNLNATLGYKIDF